MIQNHRSLNTNNTIAISGASGLIGSHLQKYFEKKHWKVIPLGRKDFETSAAMLSEKITDVKAILHFAGAPVIKRWTKAYKEEIYNSRILSTRKLVEAISLAKIKPSAMISASAVGIYNEEATHDENSTHLDQGFIGKLCFDWEAEAKTASKFCRLSVVRLGVVITKEGGALKTMLPAFRLGLGGKIASGTQPFAWIHLEDVIAAVDFLVRNKETEGIYNLVAPNLINNGQFTASLGKALKRPTWFRIPAFVLKLLYGKAAFTLTGGQKVIPTRLKNAGYEFIFPEINQALSALFHKP